MDKMEEMFDKQANQLNDKEKAVAFKIKDFIFKGYNKFIKPLLLAVFMFWLFNKIKNIVGLQEVVFIQLTLIIILLRSLNSKLG